MSQCVGLVLAGGRGERLGRDKGGVRVRGRSLAESAAAALAPLCGELLVSVAPGMANPAPEHRRVEDPPPAGRGPLAGIDTAFRGAGEADLLVLACDYPNVGTALLRVVVGAAQCGDEGVMPGDPDERDHPLVALWRRTAAGSVAAAVAEGRLTVRALLDELRVRRLGPADLPGFDLRQDLINVNSPGELESLLGPDGEADRGG